MLKMLMNMHRKNTNAYYQAVDGAPALMRVPFHAAWVGLELAGLLVAFSVLGVLLYLVAWGLDWYIGELIESPIFTTCATLALMAGPVFGLRVKILGFGVSSR